MPRDVNVKVMNDLLSTTGLIFQWCAVSIQWAHRQAVIRELLQCLPAVTALSWQAAYSHKTICVCGHQAATPVQHICPPLNWHCTTASSIATKIEQMLFPCCSKKSDSDVLTCIYQYFLFLFWFKNRFNISTSLNQIKCSLIWVVTCWAGRLCPYYFWQSKVS